MARLIDASAPLRRLLEDLDLTQAEFARAADTTVVSVNRWVNAAQRADVRTIIRAFDELGVNPEDYGIERPRTVKAGWTGDNPGAVPPAWFADATNETHRKLDAILDALEHSR